MLPGSGAFVEVDDEVIFKFECLFENKEVLDPTKESVSPQQMSFCNFL